MSSDLYQLSTNQTAQKLGVNPEVGLSLTEVAARQKEHGFNKLPEETAPSIIYFFFKQFASPLVYLLLIAFLVSLFFKEYIDAIFILCALFINAAVGAFQEFKAEKILKDLKDLASPQAKVKREGRIKIINSENLVPGDIVLLEAGFKVPADGRLIKSYLIEANESLFTGESLPARKDIEAMNFPVPIAERKNMVFLGTTITRGKGEMIVTATGLKTETGLLSKSLEETKKPPTPITEQINFLSRLIIWLVLAFSGIIFILGLAQNHLKDAFITAVTLAVSVIPEGLPAMIAVTLALGVHKMAKEKALVQNLAAVETLGQVTNLITDKTGTLTLNQFQTSAAILPIGHNFDDLELNQLSPFHPGLKKLVETVTLASDASLDSNNHFDDPLEVALLNFSQSFHLNRKELIKKNPRLFELPFESEYRYMATFHRLNSQNTSIQVKGAPEVVIKLTNKINRQFKQIVDQKQENGEKVIAFAQTVMPTRKLEAINWQPDKVRHFLERNLELVGALSLADSIRPNAPLAIKSLQSAGIAIIMATGDHPKVAENVALKLGIPPTLALGEDFKKGGIGKLLAEKSVFARIEPQSKLKMVEWLQTNQAVVAMTGDGVNDAPALKKADVGIAMGKSGTDLAKEAADVILLDDDIATITQAVKSGRQIIANLQKIISYLIATNLSELLIVFIGIAIWGLAHRPILPTQILWINLITDGIAVLPLAVEPDHHNVMLEKPRRKKEFLLSGQRGLTVILIAAIISLIGIGTFAYFYLKTGDLVLAQTAAFTVVVFAQIFNLLNNRSDKIPNTFSRLKLKSNPLLIYSVIASFVIQILILTLPISQQFLHLKALDFWQVVSLIIVSSLVFWLVELKKHLARIKRIDIFG